MQKSRIANMSLTVEKRLPGNNILAVPMWAQGRHLHSNDL
jgi:hypothetical protein